MTPSNGYERRDQTAGGVHTGLEVRDSGNTLTSLELQLVSLGSVLPILDELPGFCKKYRN